MKLKIIIDSSADLPLEILKKYDITVIPLRVYDEAGNEYLDGITLTSEELLLRMKKGELFTSSLPSYNAIYQSFHSNCLDDYCVYLTCSSDLSGTHNFAQIVKLDLLEKEPNAKIEIIDTRSVSLGIGVLVLEMVKQLEKGDSIDLVINKLHENINKIQHIFTVEDLKYLIRGGRVGKFAGFLGGMLNINPIMEVYKGRFRPIEKIRGRKKALNRILELMKARLSEEYEIIGIVYGEKDEVVENFNSQMSGLIGEDKLLINSVGSAVGVHTGPGALGIFFLSK